MLCRGDSKAVEHNNKLNSLHIIRTTLFNGEAGYNQSYLASAPINNFELFEVIIGWQKAFCLREWYSEDVNCLRGHAMYAGADYTDFYRFEITFSSFAEAQNLYTNVIARTRIHSNGTYEYDYSNVKIQVITGLSVAPL